MGKTAALVVNGDRPGQRRGVCGKCAGRAEAMMHDITRAAIVGWSMAVGAQNSGLDRRDGDHLHCERCAKHKLDRNELRQRDVQDALPPALLTTVVGHSVPLSGAGPYTAIPGEAIGRD